MKKNLWLIGAVLVMAVFAVLIYCCFKIAKQAKDRFGGLLAAGIGTIIASQTIINMAVVTASMPPTGVPLPFISHGGTSLVVFMGAIGILLNISKQSKQGLINNNNLIKNHAKILAKNKLIKVKNKSH